MIIVKTHSDFINILTKNKLITTTEYSFLIHLYQKYFENKCNNGFYQVDDYIASSINCNIRSVINIRKSLISKGIISTGKIIKNKKSLITYNINFDKLISENKEDNSTSNQLPVDMPEGCASSYQQDNVATPQPPATQPTCNNNQDLTTSATPTVEETQEIKSKAENKPNNETSPENDISGPSEDKVPEIKEKWPLNEDTPNLINNYKMSADKDKQNNVMTTKEKVKTVGVLNNIVSAFTKEEIVRWGEEINSNNYENFMNESAIRIVQLATELNVTYNYIYDKLIEYVCGKDYINPEVEAVEDNKPVYTAEVKPVEQIYDLDGIPEWCMEDLTKLYTQFVEEEIEDMYGDTSTIRKRYMKPYEAIKPLYSQMIKRYNEEEKELVKKYALLIYNNCMQNYPEYENNQVKTDI